MNVLVVEYLCTEQHTRGKPKVYKHNTQKISYKSSLETINPV